MKPSLIDAIVKVGVHNTLASFSQEVPKKAGAYLVLKEYDDIHELMVVELLWDPRNKVWRVNLSQQNWQPADSWGSERLLWGPKIAKASLSKIKGALK